MTTINSQYKVLLLKKIPFISRLLEMLMLICLAFCLVFWLLFLSSDSGGNEMIAVVLVNLTPVAVIKLIVFALLAYVPILFLYKRLRTRKGMLLCFTDTNIILRSKRSKLTLPIDQIMTVTFTEPNLHYRRLFAPRLEIYIYQKNTNLLQLETRYYDDAPELIKAFYDYPQLQDRIKEGMNSSGELIEE